MKVLIKFIGIGGVSTLLQYILLIAFVEFSGLKPAYASVTSYLMSAIFNYYANYYFTFESAEQHRKSLNKFVCVVCVGLILSGCLMHIFSELLSIYYVLAQVITTLIVLVWNFLAQKHWVFK